jgi:ATP-binding cassette subfamily C protein CydD
MKKPNQWLHLIPAGRYMLAMITLIGLFSALLLILQSYTFSLILDRVFLLARSLPQVWHLMLLFLGLLLARACLTWMREIAATHLAYRLKTHVRQQLLAHLFALGPIPLIEERRGELMSTLVDGVEAIGPYFSDYLPQRLLAVLVPALILIIMFCVDVPSGLMLLVMVPILPFLLAMVGIMTKAETQRHWLSLRLMSAHFLDVLEGLMTLKLFGRSGVQEARIGQVSERFRYTTMRTLRLAFFSSFLLEEGAAISTAIIAIEVGLRLLLGQLAFQPALFIFLLTPEFFQPLRSLGAIYHIGMAGSTALQHIHDVLKLPVSQQFALSSSDGQKPNEASVFDPITFEHVASSYDDQRPALHDVSFHILPGQKVALVGPSGAGKSTVAALLLRFISCTSGCIRVGERDLESIPLRQWRAQLAWVPQHPCLFQATVAENIRLARPQATLAEVMDAADLADAHAFICALPQGYDTLIGERGTRLSGGEAQRISLARAFLKNAPLLILDEAMTHLDAVTEAQVCDAMIRLQQGRTVLTIAHYRKTVLDADLVVVLDRGQVVALGQDERLWQYSAFYRQLMADY